MRRWIYALSASLALVAPGAPGIGFAGVSVNLNINIPLAPVAVSQPPSMAVVPGTYVYFAPDVGVDLLFYQGYWYRPHRGQWYVSAEYNGKWSHIAVGNVPPALRQLPPDYRHMPPGHQRIPYGQVKQNWRTWERDRHWDRHERREERREVRHERRRNEREERRYERSGRGRGEGRGRGRHREYDD